MRITKILKSKVIILITIAALLLPACFTSPFSLVVYAKEDEYKLDESFIPTRSWIPYYLSINSSYDSELVKKLWEKLFWEEGSNPTWSTRYYPVNSTVDKVGFVGFDGSRKSWKGINFSTNNGEFDAFFGNTIENNPEFLGELLGLTGYTKISSASNNSSTTNAIQNRMKQVVYTKLVSPQTYTYFRDSIIALTYDGSYLTNSALKSSAYNGLSFDYWVLSCIASRYEGDGSESYLSAAQVKWLQSYQLELYDAYTTNNNPTLKQLVTTYKPLYELIARSTYAANNRNGYGQTFFNYVVSTKKGAGAWLNMNNSINISGLSDINDITLVFTMSNGWCGGLCTENSSSPNYCSNRSSCVSKASPVDKIAYQLHKNSTAVSYITNNPTVNAVYSTNDENWIFKYSIKHTGAGSMSGGKYTQEIDGVRVVPANGSTIGTNVSDDGTNQFQSKNYYWGFDTGFNSFSDTTTVIVTPACFLSTASQIEVDTYGDWRATMTSWNAYTVVDGKTIDITDKGVSLLSQEGSHLTFSIGGLNNNYRKNAYILFKVSGGGSYNCDRRATSFPGITITLGAKKTATVTGTYPTCQAEGHKWKIDDKTSKWASDYSSAVLSFYCAEDASHTTTDSSPVITKVETSTYIKYTATSPGIIIDGKPAAITKTIEKTPGAGVQTITFNKNNTSGTLSATNTSTSTVYAQGSKSWDSNYKDSVFKTTSASVNATVKAGNIKAGARSVTINFTAVNQCDSITAQVISSRGRVLGSTIYSTKTATASYSPGKLTVNLAGATDYQLENAYVVISAQASTTNRAPAMYTEPANATTKITLNSMTVNYK